MLLNQILLILLFILSLGLTGLFKKYASSLLIDIPNHRSSHVIPTPRGGGLAFVISFLMAVPLLAYYAYIPINLAFALMGGGCLVAILGIIDDRVALSIRWRLPGHFIAAIFSLFCLDGAPSITFGPLILPIGMLANILVVFYLVWLLNLYNFMDGIDGLASIESITVCIGACILYTWSGQNNLIVLPSILASAVTGFLAWNFPKAKIFMGDVGSGFLGIIMGILSIQSAFINPVFFWGWLILLGVFLVDATYTLLKRAYLKQRVFDAHRQHAYQFAARRFGHVPVTLVIGLINLFWLLPIALFVVNGSIEGLYGAMIAYLPVLLLAIYFRAGCLE